jgi:hypothetical protein
MFGMPADVVVRWRLWSAVLVTTAVVVLNAFLARL